MTTTRLLQLFTKSVFAFLAVFALSASMVVAQDTWYVNSTEGDDATNLGNQLNNGTGQNGPFATLGKAISVATDDDTIVILAGAYTEDLDNGGFEGTIQAINSGGTTQVVFSGDMAVTDDVTLESIGGAFTVNGGTFDLTAGILTLADAGVLTFGTGTTVNVVNASVAGNAVSYAGLVNVDYNPTNSGANPANVVTGLEFPSNFGGGDLSTNAAFDDGSFQAAQAVAGAGDINLMGDVNATFNQAVGYSGTLNVTQDHTVAFNSTLSGGDVEQSGDAAVTVASTASLGYIDLDDGILTFNGSLALTANEGGDAVNTAVGSELNLNGAANVPGGNFVNNGEANVSDVDLDVNNLTNFGTFVMSSTLTVGDNGSAGLFGLGDPGTRRVFNSAGSTTIDNVTLERNDTAADDDDAYFIEFSNAGTQLTIAGSIAEFSATESGTGDPLTAVLELANADGSLLTVSSTNTVSGDILNAATGGPSTTEGIAVGSGATLTANGTPLTDLGIFSGGTLSLTGAGETATGLEAVGSLIMGSATGALAMDVVATGSVTLNNGAITHTVNFTAGGPLTLNNGVDINDVPGVGAETHTVGGLIVGATGTVLGLTGDEDSFTVPSGNINLADATVNGNVLGSGGTFMASGATVNGSIASGGDMTLSNVTINNAAGGFDGDLSSGGSVSINNSTVDGRFSAAGNVTQTGATTIGDGIRGPGASFSDVDGTLFVNGTLTVMDDTGAPTTGTFDFTVGGVDIAIPGGTLAMGETDLIVTGSYTGGTATGLDDVHFLLGPSEMASFQPAPNTFVETFQVTGSSAMLSLLEGFIVNGADMGGDPGYYNMSLNNDAILQLNENTVTFTGAGADVELNDEAQVMTTAPTGALVFNTGAGGSQIDVTGAPTNPPTINNFRVNSAGTILTIVDDVFVDGDITLNAGLLVIGDDANDEVEMVGPGATISRNPSAGMLTETPGDLTGAWSVKYFGTDGTASAEMSNDGTGTTTNVTLEMDGSGNVVTFPGLPAAGASNSNDFTVTTGTAYFPVAYAVGNDLLANDIVHSDAALSVANNATFNADPDLDGALTVSGNLAVGAGTDVNDVAVDGAAGGTILLDGTDAAHTIGGRVMLPTTSTAAATITGSQSQNADSGEFTALYTLNAPGETVTATDMQQMAGITVTDGTFDLTMFNDGDTLPGGDSSTEDSQIFGPIAIAAPGTMNLRGSSAGGIDGIAITEGGSFNMFTNATIDGGDLLLGTLAATSPAPNLELGGFTLSITGPATNDVIGHAEANVTSSDAGFAGTIRLASGGNIGMNGASIPNVQLDGVGLVNSNVAIPDMGTLTVNETAEMDADFNLTGDAFFNGGADLLDGVAPFGGELITLGTTLTFSANGTVIDNLNISSASTTELASVGVGAPWQFTATNFDHNTGIFDTNDTDVIVTATYDLQGGGGGSYVDDADATGYFIFRGAGFDSNGETVSMRNVQLDGGSADFVDGSDLFVSTNFNIYNGTTEQNDNDADAVVTEITVGDTANIRIDDGNLERQILGGAMAKVFVVDQPDAFTTAGGTALSIIDLEVPNSFDQLWINSNGTLAATKSVTVNTLDVNALFDNNNGIGSVNITDGGAVLISVTAGLNEAFVPAGEFALTFNGAFVTTDGNTYPAAPIVPTTLNFNGAITALHANRTANDVNVNGGAELEMGIDGATDGFGTVPVEPETNANLTVLGDLFVSPTGSVTAGGALILMGTTGQQEISTSGGLTLPNVTLNNPDGAALYGGNLTIATLLTLTDGVLTTNDNSVVLPHGSTAAQGYVQTNGVIYGNVSKTVAPVAAPAPPNRVAFPLGSSTGNNREYAITFNDPAGDLGVPVTLSVSVLETDTLRTAPAPGGTEIYTFGDPMGTNGLPISTQDVLGETQFMIGRYPRDFHWKISSAPTISPSVDYDIEYRAEAFAQFEGENIERTRAMRRQAGDTSNFWILTSPVPSDNDNFDAEGNPANPPEPVVVARNAVGAINADGALFTFGLEANMMAMDPAPLVLNAGNAEMVDLLTVFSGGDEMYTYSVIGGDADVATTAVAGDNLTVTGVDAGATSFTVEGTDGFGDTATATVTVTVNPAFEAGEALADYSVNTGADPRMVDATVAHTGGTSPVGYAVASDNAAVATATVSAAGMVTVTHVATGSANITVTATDAEGDTVVDTFAVTVNAALAATGGLTDISVTEGETSAVDASGEFTGGTPGADGYSYSASSDNADVATAAADGSMIDVSGVEPYVIVNGSVDSDAAPATVTVTAEDSLGATAMSTFMADVNPVPGNVDGFGPNPASAGLTLDFFLALETGTAKQMLAANFNGDGSVTPFDAALIFSAFLNSKDEIEPFVASSVGFGQITHENGLIQVPVLITGELDGVVSASLDARVDASFATVKSVESTLGEGWIFGHNLSEDGDLKLAIAGHGDVPSDGVIATLTLEMAPNSPAFDLSGEGAVNNNPLASIDAVEVAELPDKFALEGNYPNPFNPSTTVQFDLPETADVEIQVFDMLGRQVMTLPAQTIQAGAKRSVQVNASQLASGQYFYRVIAKMESKTLVESGRMTLVK